MFKSAYASCIRKALSLNSASALGLSSVKRDVDTSICEGIMPQKATHCYWARTWSDPFLSFRHVNYTQTCAPLGCLPISTVKRRRRGQAISPLPSQDPFDETLSFFLHNTLSDKSIGAYLTSLYVDESDAAQSFDESKLPMPFTLSLCQSHASPEPATRTLLPCFCK